MLDIFEDHTNPYNTFRLSIRDQMIFITGQWNCINFRWSNWISVSHFRFWMIFFSKMRFWNSELHNLYPKQSQIEVWFSNLSLSELKKLGVYNVHKTKPIFITPKSALFSPFLALIKHFWRKTVLTSKILMLGTQHKIVYGWKTASNAK